MKLFVAGINYRTAPLELRERLAVPSSQLASAAARLRAAGKLDEVMLLSTCNRVEIYATGEQVQGDAGSLLGSVASAPCDLAGHVYLHEGPDALAHLFAVAGGLDSMALGETEITGQLKAAYEQARAAGLTGRVLNQAFQKALCTAKKIRTQTHIGRGATSMGSAAVELAERIFGNALAEQTVLIVGAGQMGEACARHLISKGAKSLLLVNRSFERAEALAAECGGRAIPWDDGPVAIAQAGIVIASTGCPTLLFRRAEVEQWMKARHQRSLVLIDIAVPRNIDPQVNQLENVYLYDVDDLETVMRHNLQQRESELEDCRQIISHAVAALWPRLTPRPEISAVPVRPKAGWLLRDSAATAGI